MMDHFFLKHVFTFGLIAIILEISGVSGGSFGACGGQRLDKLAKEQSMTASRCISMGGTCCGTDPSVRDSQNDDPRKMKPTDKCFTCYNSDVSVKCTGKLIRFKPAREEDGLITAGKCVQVGGNCCQKSDTYAFRPQVIMDNDCINCYSGDVALPCEGKLLASSDYTAKTCTTFGGRCCDESPTGGDAYDSKKFPNPESLSCTYCYSGMPKTSSG